MKKRRVGMPKTSRFQLNPSSQYTHHISMHAYDHPFTKLIIISNDPRVPLKVPVRSIIITNSGPEIEQKTRASSEQKTRAAYKKVCRPCRDLKLYKVVKYDDRTPFWALPPSNNGCRAHNWALFVKKVLFWWAPKQGLIKGKIEKCDELKPFRFIVVSP